MKLNTKYNKMVGCAVHIQLASGSPYAKIKLFLNMNFKNPFAYLNGIKNSLQLNLYVKT